MWFWRGTQSAIFYYVSLSPCLEYNHKRKRRKEANRSQKERAELEVLQPGLIHQPVPFQTNQFWAEEIDAGPGPPRGWRKHNFDEKTKRVGNGKKKAKNQKKSVFSPERQAAVNETSPPTTSSSSEAAQTGEIQPVRPSLRVSTTGAASTLDALKDTIRSTIARPDNWNWKRYEREDETLFGINDRISRMWDRATQHGRQSSTDRGRPLTPGRKRVNTGDSDDHSWLYARNPGVNDLHPPTVSQLPRTKREVAWIMQPPPSRAVMEGKVRPGTEVRNRRPLCTIEGTPVHHKRPDTLENRENNDGPSIANRKRPPDTLLSPGGTVNSEAENDGEAEDEEDDDDDDDDDAEEATQATSTREDHLSSQLPPPFPAHTHSPHRHYHHHHHHPPSALPPQPHSTTPPPHLSAVHRSPSSSTPPPNHPLGFNLTSSPFHSTPRKSAIPTPLAPLLPPHHH